MHFLRGLAETPLPKQEVTALVRAAGQVGRHGALDATLILLAHRHGLPHLTRRTHGVPCVHLLRGPELRALRRLPRDYPATAYLFLSERKAPLMTDAVRKIVGGAGRHAGLAFPAYPHLLRHGAGYKAINAGQVTRAIQQYLGHRNIQHTTAAGKYLRPLRSRAPSVQSGLRSGSVRDWR